MDQEAAGKSHQEKRLDLYQSLKAEGVVSEDAAFFLIAYTVEWLAEQSLAADFNQRMEQAQNAADPAEFHRLLEQGRPDKRQIVADIFRGRGEAEMAELYLRRQDLYKQRKEAGRREYLEAGGRLLH